jgi:hypothetical protein
MKSLTLISVAMLALATAAEAEPSERMKWLLVAVPCFQGGGAVVGDDGPMPQTATGTFETPAPGSPAVHHGELTFPIVIPESDAHSGPSLHILIKLMTATKSVTLAYEPVWVSVPLPTPEAPENPEEAGARTPVIWWVTIGFTIRTQDVEAGGEEADQRTPPAVEVTLGILRAMEDVFER